MAPATQKAVVVQADGNVVLQSNFPVTKPEPGEILVKVAAAAQNPTDWKTAMGAKRAGSVIGCDFAGTVEEFGPNVVPGVRTIGEPVAGFIHGVSLHPNGSFSERLVTSAEFVVHVPDEWSFEEAAQLGIAPFTALQTLYQSHKGLPTPLAPASPPGQQAILVSGDVSSVGQYVVQFAHLSGLRVLATASKKNFDFLKALGADEVFDYNDPEVAKKIKEGAKISVAVDTISEGLTPELLANALSDDGGIVAVILPYQSLRSDVETVPSLAYQLLGKDYNFPEKNVGTEEQKDRGRMYVKFLSDILATGKVKPNPLLVLPKGLASVPDGFQYMVEGKVSAQKLTYRIADTPNE